MRPTRNRSRRDSCQPAKTRRQPSPAVSGSVMTARRSSHSGHSFTSVRAMITLGVGTGQGPKARDIRPGGPRPQVTATEVRLTMPRGRGGRTRDLRPRKRVFSRAHHGLIQAAERILEVGTGHGYQTALLARLAVPAASRDHRPYRYVSAFGAVSLEASAEVGRMRPAWPRGSTQLRPRYTAPSSAASSPVMSAVTASGGISPLCWSRSSYSGQRPVRLTCTCTATRRDSWRSRSSSARACRVTDGSMRPASE